MKTISPQTELLVGLALSSEFSFYREILRGFFRFAQRRPNWHFMFMAPKAIRPTREALKHVDAVIASISSRQWCDDLMESGVPVVHVDAIIPGLPIPRLCIDDELVGRMAAQHFLERRIRSFGFVSQPRFLFSQMREKAFRSALQATGHKLAVYQIRAAPQLGPMSCVRFADRALGRWLSLLPHPTGIFSPDDLWGVEIMETCRELDLRVPEDIAVLGVDNDDLYCTVSKPPLSSIILPTEAIGIRAAATVERLIRTGKQHLSREILLPPVSVAVRRSTDVLAIKDANVVTALRFIRENCHRSIQVADVLKQVPVSRRWLERRVLEELGITLGAEIRRTRLERAKQLLIESDLSMAEVATHSGHAELRNMELAFRRELGTTPTEFRRQVTGL